MLSIFLAIGIFAVSVAAQEKEETTHVISFGGAANSKILCGGQRGFSLDCPDVNLGEDYRSALRTYSEHCDDHFMKMIREGKCSCVHYDLGPDGRPSNKTTRPVTNTATRPRLTSYFGLHNGFATSFRFKDGKISDEDGDNITCGNVDKYRKEARRRAVGSSEVGK